MKRYIRAAIRSVSEEPIEVQLELLLFGGSDLTPEILDELAHSWKEYEAWKVRFYVAMDERTTPDTLTYLAGDPNVMVRREVAKNTHTPTSVLKILAADSTEDVRYALIANPNTTDDIRCILATDSNDVIRSVAIQHIANADMLDGLADSDDPDIQYEIASNPCVSQETLRKLANIPNADHFVLRAVATAIEDPEVLSILSDYPDSGVKFFVAKNPNTSIETLQKLAKDYNAPPRVAAKARLSKLSE